MLHSAHALALDATDGAAQRPPMGWRSWNQFQGEISQSVIEAQMSALVDRRRHVDGKPTSLADLGYTDVGIDDGWQQCGHYGPLAYRYHAADGSPVVDVRKFPDLRELTGRAHALGLTAGWYGNACGCVDGCCSDHCDSVECFAGDVNATVALGFDSYKIDGCGAQRDIALWYRLFNHTLRERPGASPMLLENCHDGDGEPEGNAPHYDARGGLWCPFHTYRASADARPTYGSVLSNLNATVAFTHANLSVPGCWAYADMLEVGVTNTQMLPAGHGMNCGASLEERCPPLSVVEARTHFGAWCVVSSPLVLGLDLRDAATLDAHWDTLANPDAIAINQDYAGHAGGPFFSTDREPPIRFAACGWGRTPGRSDGACTWPRLIYLAKPLSGARAVRGDRMALLLLNNGPNTTDLTVAWASVPRLGAVGRGGCRVYDVWRRRSLGQWQGEAFVARAVGARDSVFVTLGACDRPGGA